MSVLSSSSQPRNYLNKNKSQKSQKLQPLTFLSLSGFYQQNTHEKISNHNLQGYSFFHSVVFSSEQHQAQYHHTMEFR